MNWRAWPRPPAPAGSPNGAHQDQFDGAYGRIVEA